MAPISKKIFLILTSILFCFLSNAFGQKEETKEIRINKNAIYGNVGMGGFYFTATIYYERIIKHNTKNSTFVKVGTGRYALWGVGGQFVFAQFGILTGINKHHLEFGIGPNYFINGDLRGEVPVSATMGWRIQKPGKKFIFRMGASWPEAIYIGIGTSF